MKLLGIVLIPISLLYGIGIALRNLCFDLRILPQQTFDINVISVGNIASGGTGKSPHVEYLIRLLKEVSTVATLSRGYGRISRGFMFAEEQSQSYDIGDEPKQFKMKFPQITVAVDGNRRRGIEKLISNNPRLQTIILDDGFQHRYVKPNLSIILTDYSNLYINDFLLPSGKLREPKSASRRADIIIVTKTPAIFSPLERRVIKKKLNPKPYQHVYFSYVKYGDFIPLKVKKGVKPLAKEFYFERDFSVLLVTGIANPSSLEYYLETNFKSMKHLRFKDHHNYSEMDVEKIQKIFDNIANENKIVLTTEKDAMRLSIPSLHEKLKDLPLFYIPIEMAFHKGDKEGFNNQIIRHVRRDKIDSEVYKRKN